MCTRILNNLNTKYVMTGRNFDWHYPLTTYLYRFPASGELRTGKDKDLDVDNEFVTWTAEYASICNYIGSDELGFAAIDGINAVGLVVNGLEDLLANFEDAEKIINGGLSALPQLLDKLAEDKKAFFKPLPIPEGAKLLSSMRWVQFVLDNFATVEHAADYFRRNPENIFVYSGDAPDGRPETTKANLHLAISDTDGNSAVIELRGGQFVVHESKNYNVVTVTPRFEVQQLLLQPWLEKWKSPKHLGSMTFYDVPGGTATHQRFARANYFYMFANPESTEQAALAQTRALMATCATPLSCHFDGEGENVVPSATTQWVSIGDHQNQRYHLVNSNSLTHQWLQVSSATEKAERVKLTCHEGSGIDTVYGDLEHHLKAVNVPFEA